MQKIKSFKEFLISIFVEFTLQIILIFGGLIYFAYVFIGLGALLLCLPYMWVIYYFGKINHNFFYLLTAIFRFL